MKNKVLHNIIRFVALIICSHYSFSQNSMTTNDFKDHTTYFSLSKDHQFQGNKMYKKLKQITKNAQFIGIAEVHQSEQLSYFTSSFLELLSEQCFNNFALELGPYSAKILAEISVNPEDTRLNINKLNRLYGKKEFPKIPLIFVDKVEDVKFINTASSLGYNFWGLDQEYLFSYEMHLDRLYEHYNNKTPEFIQLYNASKVVLENAIFKNKLPKGETSNCWLKDNETLNAFFSKFDSNDSAIKYINALKTSMGIYCKQETASGGNQERADYMKSNFMIKYNQLLKKEAKPKVVLKLGSVHLTHSTSQLGVNDIGKFLSEKAKANNTEFLSFFYLPRYKNGEDLINNDQFKSLSIVLSLGKKNKWTLIDLRPIRKMMLEGQLNTKNEIVAFGLISYDFVLIPPDDKNGTLNY
ncbi:hypothetical protein [uncultured Psychroserpens sp.]|uniref:hypothetical protein n=1 Tax=uncultured Psychroserpens sp. TaxID=255436 RepID=UPI00261F4DE0|nr:hypothetical protein [uncultured Psychroserpens sp.]